VLLNCKAHWLSTNTQPSRPLPNVRCDSRNHFARQKIRSLTNAAVQTANLELSRLQKREAVLSERLERRNADLLHETVGAEERIAMLNAGATPRRALEIQIEQLKAKVRHADEVIAQLQRELAGFSGAQRVAELQNLQEIADAREIDSNRRNASLLSEIARVEREIDAIAASELFKARISMQKQMRDQCKQLKQKIAELDQ
jgi:hypothetical protein